MRDSVETYRVITANRLDDGAVVYMTRDGDGIGWSTVVADATMFPEADKEAMIGLAAGAVADNLVVDVYAIEITGKNKPMGMREKIRAGGAPTIAVGEGGPPPDDPDYTI